MEKAAGPVYHGITRETGAAHRGRPGTGKEYPMKEYKMIKCSQREAEDIMNEMADRGWRVVCVTYWAYWWIHLLITFERER